MSKSKHTRSKFEKYDEEQDDWRTNRDEHRRKVSNKRINAALKTKNIDQLRELDDELYD
jgi:hypothetical protein